MSLEQQVARAVLRARSSTASVDAVSCSTFSESWEQAAGAEKNGCAGTDEDREAVTTLALLRWRRTILRVRAARAFSDAGKNHRDKREKRTARRWRVSIAKVIAINFFLRRLQEVRKENFLETMRSNCDTPTRISRAARKRWRMAGIKLVAMQRLCNGPVEGRKVRQELKRCQLQVLKGPNGDDANATLEQLSVVTSRHVDEEEINIVKEEEESDEEEDTDDEEDEIDAESYGEAYEMDSVSELWNIKDADFEKRWNGLSYAGSGSFKAESTDGTSGEFGETFVSADDFEPLRVVGTGGSGQVYLVQHLKTRKRFAMKVLNKADIIATNRIKRVINERKILTLSHESSFLTQLEFAFHSDDMLFFVMEYCAGGNLHEAMIREHEINRATMSRENYRFAMDAAAEGRGLLGALQYISYFNKFKKRRRTSRDILTGFGLHEEQVKFITAEVIEGLLFLHRKGFVYRDLKPQNVMLNVDGHVRIGDFGIANSGQVSNQHFVSLRSNSFVGTLEYMAPEVVSGDKQSSAVDVWTLGILIFELLSGSPPFIARDGDPENRTLFKMILCPSKYLSFSLTVTCSKDALNFCESCLKKDPRSRPNLVDAKAHPFLQDISWSSLSNSSGFHKLQPRLHLHRPEEHVRPRSLNGNMSQNIFVSSTDDSLRPRRRMPGPPGRRAIRSVSAFTSSERNLLGGAGVQNSNSSPCSATESMLPKVELDIIEDSETEKKLVTQYSSMASHHKTLKRVGSRNSSTGISSGSSVFRRFRSWGISLRRGQNSNSSAKNEGNVEIAKASEVSDGKLLRKFHSGRTKDDASELDSEQFNSFNDFNWKKSVQHD